MQEQEQEQEAFDFNSKLGNMRQSEDKKMKIIALYWLYKGWRFQNKLQYEKALRRELRASKELLGYDSEQITRTMDFCDSEFDMWTLETCCLRIEDIALR